MLYFLLVLNCLLSVAITAAFFPYVGVGVLIFTIFMLTIGCHTAVGDFFLKTQMKTWGENVKQIVFRTKRVLMSVACLTFSLKVGTAIALFVETGAALMIAFCILFAFGYLFEGPGSGMTIGMSYGIARLVVKLFSLITVGFDKIAEWIAKIELRILKIDY